MASNAVPLTVLTVFAVSAAGQPFFEPLGVPGRAYGVSPDGSVVVGTALAHGAFRWTLTGGAEVLDDPLGHFQTSEAYAASTGGLVIVGFGDIGNNEYEAFRWTAQTGLVGLGDLPGGTVQSAARGVSTDGSLVVGRGDFKGSEEAFRWTQEGGMQELPPWYPQGALGVFADGSRIVGAGYHDDGYSICAYVGYVWDDHQGLKSLLPAFKSCSSEDCFAFGNSAALAVSADGSVIVGESTVQGSTCPDGLPVRWLNGEPEPLGNLPDDPTNGVAFGVSADGSVIVGAARAFGGGSRAFVWTAQDGMRDLRELLLANGLEVVAGWSNFEAHGVSGDGNVIVGYADDPDGLIQAWAVYMDLPCYADADGSGTLDLFDFLTFVNLFNGSAAYADCDQNGVLDLFDFLCFVNAFNGGC